MSDAAPLLWLVGEAVAHEAALTIAAGPEASVHRAATAEAIATSPDIDAVAVAAEAALPNPAPWLQAVRKRAPMAQVLFVGGPEAVGQVRQMLVLHGGPGEAWSTLKTDAPDQWPLIVREAQSRAARRRALKQAAPSRAATPTFEDRKRPDVPESVYLKSVLEQAQESILFLDARGRVTAWNRSAEERYSHVPGASRGQSAMRLVAPEYRDDQARFFASVLEDGAPVLYQIEHLGANGRIPVEVSMTPVKDWRGLTVGVTMIARDISERLLAERTQLLEAERQAAEAHARMMEVANAELLAQSEELAAQQEELNALYEEQRRINEQIEAVVAARTRELEAANAQLRELDRAKDEFLGVISHELRTPLNFIMGFASVLGDELQGPLTPEQHRSLSKILAGTDRMLHLVDDLLDFARMQAGRFDLVCEPTPYAPLVAEVVASLRPLAEPRRVTLTHEVPDGVVLLVDGQRVSQVLMNLVANAIKFTPEGGTVHVSARCEGDRLVTEVTDTGVGIDPADLPKLFTPFKQLDMSMTRRSGGTGLGLSIARALVEAHGGTIEAESAGRDRGSTFRFALPLGG